MKTLRTMAACLVALILVTTNAYAQDINDYLDTNGEIVFVMGSLDPNLTENPEITLNLNGPVFRDDADYQVAVENTHDDYSTYGSADLYGTSMTLEEGTREIICWESVFEDDESAAAAICPGMVGWGEYEVSITSDENTFSFDISTLDGEWMKNRGTNPYEDTAAYQMIFYIDFGETEITVKIYDWKIEDWDPVYVGTRETFWENHAGGRERTTIDALSTDFTISSQSTIPKVLDEVTFDINIAVGYYITVSNDKTVRTTDYYDGHNDQYVPSYWKFDADGMLWAYGHFSTNSIDPNILTRSTKAVYFQPKIKLVGADNNNSWKGIWSMNNPLKQYEWTYDLRHASVSNAFNGIVGYGATWTISNSSFDSCRHGIRSQYCNVKIDSSKVYGCGIGILLGGDMDFEDNPSYVNESEVFYSSKTGIEVTDNYSDLEYPEDALIIRNSEIKFSGWHGISTDNGLCAVRDCKLTKNGWRWGVLPTSDSTGAHGLNCEDGFVHIHGSEFDTNTLYGVGAERSDMMGKARSNGFGDAADVHGENCFDNNWINMNAAHRSGLEMGDSEDPASGVYSNDFNAFNRPRHVNPATQYGVNIRLRNKSDLDAQHNYWYPAFTESIDFEGGFPNVDNPITSADSVSCGVGAGSSSGSGHSENDSETTKRLHRNYLAREYQATYDTATYFMSDSLTDRESLIYIRSLEYAYLFGGIDSALCYIENEALEAKNPDEACTELDLAAMSILRTVYLLKGDSASFYTLNDSIRARLPLGDNPELDTMLVDLYDIKGALYLQEDTTLADSLITILHGKHPFQNRVKNLYFKITGDTSIYHKPATKRSIDQSQGAVMPHDVLLYPAYPNPFNPCTTISYSLPEAMIIDVMVYDSFGRLVAILYSGERPAGFHSEQFDAANMPSGSYHCVLRADKSTEVQRIVLIK